MKTTKSICICLSDLKTYSETFIKAHIDHLHAEVIYKSMLPNQDFFSQQIENDSPKTILQHLAGAVRRILRSMDNRKKEKRIQEKIKDRSIGIVLAEYGHIGVAVMETCKKNRLPLVVHFHGFDAYKKETLKKFKKGYTELFEYSSAIIVVSRDMQKQLLSLGAPASKVHYNVYGVDLGKFKKSDCLNSQKSFLFVGRFVEKKAPYLAILAFKKALEKVPDAKFYLVGDGLLWDVCKNLIHSLKIEKSVILLGPKTHSEVVELMQAARAYVQHSITPLNGDSEGTPNSVLEAQASGVPVISTKHAGIPDVVIHGETGFLVEEGDVDGMADYMVELLNDATLASRMGEKGYHHAVQNYSITESISKLRSILLSHMSS